MPTPDAIIPVVLADDDAHITCVVAMQLEKAGYKVTVARDGEEAFDAILQARPALVITDLQMPRMSGLELALKLRQTPEVASTPVIMLTARGYLADESLLTKTNIKRILAKPFSAREVVKLAGEVIANPNSGAAAA
jgi:DNA-binding response OmpR family regulator